MPTELLFRGDAYLRETEARIVAADETGLVLDRTVFYAQGGGQPGDRGRLVREDGTEIAVLDTVYGADKCTVLHRIGPDTARPAPGERVRLVLDWPLRHARMRVHTALHLLSVALPYPVTGGSIGDGEGRLDFDIPDAGLDKETVTAQLREMIERDAAVSERWISDEELEANPGLVKTMSVKPPMGSGRVRLVAIDGLDLQPCGGTHVRRTGEIGAATITAIEKKGKQNRRVRLSLA
ncbi:alanyl-tRNA editing protein [Methylobacterium platani]|uniref:Alanine--tRNA ligase n=2 Tax=Methylobacterium platani TaxID=427683 RepID=A0A179SC10_9HYPH|nr:alanyl-tRNA editing protein [Methylobacterium platani]KMO21861.1 Ala-tRNA(Pro) hydrolase [Methylobacterium platani JCM 14648]OAS24937.1 Ala-tRNA(Pro) hydrolase [Methylobacterium platani]